MTIKEQERKAMEQIRKIVDGLGEYSYIAAAMEGVWDIMEENISNDFAISMADKLKEKDKEIASMKDRAEKAEAELHDANLEIKSMSDHLQAANDNAANLFKLIDMKDETERKQSSEISRLHAENGDLVCTVASLKEEVIHLKAKLYDMIELSSKLGKEIK